MDFTDIFKQVLGGGLFSSPEDEEEKKRRAAQAGVPLGGALPAEEQKPGFGGMFGGLLPSDPTKRDALSSGLIDAGAAMMVAGGPSRDPTNIWSVLGSGIGHGSKAYRAGLDDAQKRAGEQVKLEQAKNLEEMRSGLFGGSGPSGSNGDFGYSIEQLKQYFQYQIAAGDDAGARDTLGMIQKLQQEAASKGMVVGADGSLEAAPGYNEGLSATEEAKAGGRVQGEEAYRQTDDIREYNLYVEQSKAAGTEPEDFTTWMRKGKAAGATQVNVGGNSNKFAEKLDESAAKRYDEIAAQGAGASQMVGDMDLLLDLGRKAKTGKSAEVLSALGPYAEMAGVKIDGLNEIQAYEAVVARIAPNLRPAGSGATSDFDAKQFLKSIPSIGNTAEGNEIIAVTMQAVAKNKMDAAEIANRVNRGELSWQDGDKEIAALPNPYERFKAYQKEKKDKPTKVFGVDTNESADESAPISYPTVNTPAEVQKLPASVEFFFTPDGKRKRNPNYKN